MSSGWTAEGKPWIAFEVTAAFIGSPSIAPPKDLRRVLAAREYDVTTEKGRRAGTIKPDSSGAFLYGWHTVMGVVGVDVGDVLRASFDLIEGAAVVAVGGAELLAA
jgi:hypothetical protein